MPGKIKEECLNRSGCSTHGWAHTDAHGSLESTVTGCAGSCVHTVAGDYDLAGNLKIGGGVAKSAAELLTFGNYSGKGEGTPSSSLAVSI